MTSPDRLYELLPALYRIRDQQPHGEPPRQDELRALMGLIQEQHDALEADIAGLYDDWFIETCADWVVPYIADLLGVRLLHPVDSAGLPSQRALVANTLGYRRRKGTVAVIEDLARDVTGWRARAVEGFAQIGWTQNLNHLRRAAADNPDPATPGRLNPPASDRVGTVNLRNLDACDRIGGPFELSSRSADIRPPATTEGRYNLGDLAIFLWRLQSFPITGVRARRSQDYSDGFHFSPLGAPMPLFTNPEPEDPFAAAAERNLPGPIRPLAFHRDPGAHYGTAADLSLAVARGRAPGTVTPVPLGEVMCKDLSDWSPPPGPGAPGVARVAVDLRLGRIAFAPGEAPDEGVTVTCHYGFPAAIGGGPYARRAARAPRRAGDWTRLVARRRPEGVPTEAHAETLSDALAAWAADAPERAIITMADNDTYAETLSVALTGQQQLVIEADDRTRPVLRCLDGGGGLGKFRIEGPDGNAARLALSGLWIEGGIAVADGALARLDLADCTLVPGGALDEAGLPQEPDRASLTIAADSDELELVAERCILGPVRAARTVRAIRFRDCILDALPGSASGPAVALAADDAADTDGPPVRFERCTVLGRVFVRQIDLGSETLFVGPVLAVRRQTGCLRFCYVDDLTARTPRRYRCQPELALASRARALGLAALPQAERDAIRARLRPRFTSRRYGRPAYLQLASDIAREIAEGAETGAEIGVYAHLQQALRRANLDAQLEEYMPYGLLPGIVHVT